MRGNGRSIATVLIDALAGRADARLAAAAAAFAEACGWPLAREVALRAVTREGRLIAVASTRAWADQVAALEATIRARINARLGAGTAASLEIRVGPLDR